MPVWWPTPSASRLPSGQSCTENPPASHIANLAANVAGCSGEAAGRPDDEISGNRSFLAGVWPVERESRADLYDGRWANALRRAVSCRALQLCST